MTLTWKQISKALHGETLNLALEGMDVPKALDQALDDMYMAGLISAHEIAQRYPHDFYGIEQDVVKQRDIIWAKESELDVKLA